MAAFLASTLSSSTRIYFISLLLLPLRISSLLIYQVQKKVRRRNLSLKKIVFILIKSSNANNMPSIPVLVCTTLQKLASPQLPVLLYYWNICRVGCFSQCCASMLRKVLHCERTVSEELRAYVLSWRWSVLTFCWGLGLFGKVVLLRWQAEFCQLASNLHKLLATRNKCLELNIIGVQT